MIYDLLQVYGYAVIEDRKTATAVATFMQSLAPLNSLANPMIYCLFSTHVCRNIRYEFVFGVDSREELSLFQKPLLSYSTTIKTQ